MNTINCLAPIIVTIQGLSWTGRNKIQTDWKIKSLDFEPSIPLRFFQLPLAYSGIYPTGLEILAVAISAFSPV